MGSTVQYFTYRADVPASAFLKRVLEGEIEFPTQDAAARKAPAFLWPEWPQNECRRRITNKYTARPPQVIFDLLFSHPAALQSLADAPASSTFCALQAEKIAVSNFHLLWPRGV